MNIKTLYIEITDICNLHCKTCDNFTDSEHFTLEEIKRILDNAKEKNVRQLFITGGEPLTHRNIYDIIAYAHKLHFHVNMSCNGTLVTEDVVEKLTRAGLNNISLSLDGTKEVNDSIRGKGVYDKVLATLQLFQKAKLSRMVNILFTISYSNYITLPYVVETVRKYGVRQMFLNAFDPAFLVKHKVEKSKELWIPEEELGQLEKILTESRVLADKIGVRFPTMEYLENIIRYFKGERIIPIHGCNIPATSCSIKVNGQVSACWKQDTSYFVQNTKLTNIWESQEYQNIVKRAFQGKCRGCLYACYSEDSI